MCEREKCFLYFAIYIRARACRPRRRIIIIISESAFYIPICLVVCREKREQNARENKEEKEEKSRPRKVLLLRAREVVKKVFFSSRAFESRRASRETSGVERYNILFFRKI